MYTTKGDRRAIATRDRSRRSSSVPGYATARAKARPERKSRGSYSRDNNTSWEYGYNNNGSGSINRAPDPSMCVNHTMEFVNLDNYISNMFG